MAQTATTLKSYVVAPVNYVLMRGLLSAAKRTYPYSNGTVAGELETQKGSAQVKWRRIDNLAVSATPAPLGEITNYSATGQQGHTPLTPTITDLTVVVQKYGDFMNITEEVDLINVNSRTAQLVDNLGEQAGHKMNVLQRNVFNAVTTTRFGGGVLSNGALTTNSVILNDIKYAVNQLARNSAMKFYPMGTGALEHNTSPIRSSYFGICHVDTTEDIRLLSGFIPVEQYGGYTETFTNEFGNVGGVRFCETEIGPISEDATTQTAAGARGSSDVTNDIYSTFIYGREAVGSVGLSVMHTQGIYRGGDDQSAIELIMKGVTTGGASNPYNEIGSIAYKSWWAGKVLNSNWVAKIAHLTSDLST